MVAQRRLLEVVRTPLGDFCLVANEDGALCASGFAVGHARMERQLVLYAQDSMVPLVSARIPGGAADAVSAYFSGQLDALDTLAVADAGTVFERSVWRLLRTIPAGQTRSYQGIAQQVGRPRAARAVGCANGKNPAGLVVPCHRVVGSNRSLTGFGGGMHRKRWLLQHESGPTVFPGVAVQPTFVSIA